MTEFGNAKVVDNARLLPWRGWPISVRRLGTGSAVATGDSRKVRRTLFGSWGEASAFMFLSFQHRPRSVTERKDRPAL